MIETPGPVRIDGKYVALTIFAVIFSWILHEFCHWITGELIGYQMAMTLNTAYPLSGSFINNRDYMIVSAAGPSFTMIEALIVFIIIIKKSNKHFYPFLLTCFYMRLLATVISIFNLNDEARISKSLGMGTFTLPIIVTAILFYMVYRITKLYKFNSRFNLLTLVLIIVVSSFVVLSDQFFKVRLI